MEPATGMVDLLGATPLKKIQSPFSRSRQLSIGSQLGGRASETSLIFCILSRPPRVLRVYQYSVPLVSRSHNFALVSPWPLALSPSAPSSMAVPVPSTARVAQRSHVAEHSAHWQIVSFFTTYGLLDKWTSLYGLRTALKCGFRDSH